MLPINTSVVIAYILILSSNAVDICTFNTNTYFNFYAVDTYYLPTLRFTFLCTLLETWHRGLDLCLFKVPSLFLGLTSLEPSEDNYFELLVADRHSDDSNNIWDNETKKSCHFEFAARQPTHEFIRDNRFILWQ